MEKTLIELMKVEGEYKVVGTKDVIHPEIVSGPFLMAMCGGTETENIMKFNQGNPESNSYIVSGREHLEVTRFPGGDYDFCALVICKIPDEIYQKALGQLEVTI